MKRQQVAPAFGHAASEALRKPGAAAAMAWRESAAPLASRASADAAGNVQLDTAIWHFVAGTNDPSRRFRKIPS